MSSQDTLDYELRDRRHRSSPPSDDSIFGQRHQLDFGPAGSVHDADVQLGDKRKRYDAEDHSSQPSIFSTPKVHTAGFTSAAAWGSVSALRASQGGQPYTSPEAPKQQDYSTWFDSDTNSLAGDEPIPGFGAVSFPGFTALTRSSKTILPSAEALRAAAERMKEWEDETSISAEEGHDATLKVAERVASAKKRRVDQKPFKPPLMPSTPTPAPRPQVPSGADPLTRARATVVTEKAGTGASSQPVNPTKAFSTPKASTLFSTPAKIYQYHPSHPIAKASAAQTPKVVTTPFKISTSFGPQQATPSGSGKKVLGMRTNPRMHASRPKFVTPFKTGFGPPSSGTPSVVGKGKAKAVDPPTGPPTPVLPPAAVFDLTVPTNRIPLRSQQRPVPPPAEILASRPPELSEISLSNAEYFSFYLEEGGVGSVAAALDRLKQAGCKLISKEWVDNHWKLVIWKMAGRVNAWPELTSSWTFDEAIRQLKYRYEREINQCQRPAIRLIQERDAPSTAALVLCVSDIIWPEAGSTDQAVQLELTDSWYRIRARADAPLLRAIKKGKLTVGRKIAFAGARLDAPRKDASDVLQSLTSSHLILTGNSTCLAAWYTKLGFQMRPFVATLTSLTPDGGLVMLLDLVVVKIFPLGFMETLPDGGTVFRNEAEERECANIWQDGRAGEELRMRDQLEKKISKLQQTADRLERMSGTFHPRESDCQPDEVDDLYDELEEADDVGPILQRVTPQIAGWLCLCIRRRCMTESERMASEMQDELNTSFPPRNLRNLRIVRFKDAVVSRKPGKRTAQITIWEVLSLGDEKYFQEGQRFLISNLMPASSRAWNDEGDVYLSTRRDSRWTRVGD